jgi:hypothetical protein
VKEERRVETKRRPGKNKFELAPNGRVRSDEAGAVHDKLNDQVIDDWEPKRHPAAVDRLTGQRPSEAVDHSGGELPGRKVDPRR